MIKKLPTINDPLPYTILQDIDIDSYKIVKKGRKEIIIESEGELKPISSGVGEYAPEINIKLSKIIKDLNEAFGTTFSEDDKVFLGRVKDNLLDNKDLINKIEHNSKENVKAVFDKFFWKEVAKLLRNNQEFYKRIVDNEKLREKLKSALFELVYYEYNKTKKLKRDADEKT